MRLSMVHRPTHPMTAPKNSEAQNEELDLEQLEEAAGGVIHPSYLIDPTKIVDPIQKQRSKLGDFRSIGEPPDPELWREMQNKADSRYPNPQK